MHSIGVLVIRTEDTGKETAYGPFSDTADAEEWIAATGIAKEGDALRVVTVMCSNCYYHESQQPKVVKHEDNVTHIQFGEKHERH